MNILFPIAGRGNRFNLVSNTLPKPLFQINDKTILEYSISSLKLDGNYIFVAFKYQNDEYNQMIRDVIKKSVPSATIIYQTHAPIGAADTCLLATSMIDTLTPIVVTNCDQYLNWNPKVMMDLIDSTNPDGSVSLYDHNDIEVGKPGKYAYVALDEDGYATKFAEKFAISKHALNGIHYWKHGKYFVSSINQMIADRVMVNNEFYISPSFNYLINSGKKINTFKMDKHQYYSLGSPAEINDNLNYITTQ